MPFGCSFRGKFFQFTTQWFIKACMCSLSDMTYLIGHVIYLYISKSLSTVFIIITLLLNHINSHIIHPFSIFYLFFFLINLLTYCYTFSNFSPPFYIFMISSPHNYLFNITYLLSLYLPLFFVFLIPLILL